MGFLEPVVARIPLRTERERLRGLLEAKWDAPPGRPRRGRRRGGRGRRCLTRPLRADVAAVAGT